MTWILHEGDCLEVMRDMPAESIDACVIDPPAGISFMNKSWDSNKGGRDAWIAWMTEIGAECLRLLKPGGHALVWTLPRTSHWTATAWENAGFEVRDRVSHIFGQGFPKSADISKAIDREAGAERQVIGYKPRTGGGRSNPNQNDGWKRPWMEEEPDKVWQVTAPATPAAQEWRGWGTALKPAVEDWWLLRKSLDKGLTVAANVLRHGTGAVNVDATRIATSDDLNGGAYSANKTNDGEWGTMHRYTGKEYTQPQGRWPANVCFDEEAAAELDRMSGDLTRWFNKPRKGNGESINLFREHKGSGAAPILDSGGASRFFYCAKASSKERGEANNHPTVKPLALMRWLCRLVGPPNGVILDPFAGSGTTLLAAVQEGFSVIGIELSHDYCEIIRKRMADNELPLLAGR